ncbi:MAG: hypothetical protein IKA47_10890 [Oscillospiraceae bacterium]|nr:hypothetical protein [Oscillospiraceae bacterium]
MKAKKTKYVAPEAEIIDFTAREALAVIYEQSNEAPIGPQPEGGVGSRGF